MAGCVESIVDFENNNVVVDDDNNNSEMIVMLKKMAIVMKTLMILQRSLQETFDQRHISHGISTEEIIKFIREC